MLPRPGDWAPSGRPCRTWTCFSRIRRLLKVRFPSMQYLGAAGGWARGSRGRPRPRAAPRGRGAGLPARVHTLDALMVDPDVAPQAGGRAEGALAQAAGELLHRLRQRGGDAQGQGRAGRPHGRPRSPPRSPCRAPSSCGPRTRHAQGTRSGKGHRSSLQGPHPQPWCLWPPGPAGAVWLDEGAPGSWVLPPLRRMRTTAPQLAPPLPETQPAPRARPWGS